MNIIIGKEAGFCFGVRNAVDKTKELLKEGNPTYCIGEIVHNRFVVEELEKDGLKVIEDITEIETKEPNINIIIRAHGVSPEVYTRIKEKEYKLLDLTCPKVLIIHKIAEEYIKKNYFVLLIGQKNHPEVSGTYGYCGGNDNCIIIQTKEELIEAVNYIENSNINNILVISQTTFNLEKFNEFSEYLNEKMSSKELVIKNTICSSTKIKQAETEELSKKVDCMIIIGGRNSSNTRKLYDISLKNCNKSIIIEDSSELNFEELENYNTIGIMAGASTPNSSINEVVEAIKSRNVTK